MDTVSTVYDKAVTVSTMTTRKPRALRLGDGGVRAIQKIADREQCSWSEAARRMLAYASHKMPEGYGAPARMEGEDDD